MTKIAAIVICIIVVIGIVALLIWMAKAEHDFENTDDMESKDKK